MSEEPERAAGRLAAAHDERRRLSNRLDGMRGTAGEFHAAVQLHAAEEQVAARDSWIQALERSDAESS
jgi:hypothetical protein